MKNVDSLAGGIRLEGTCMCREGESLLSSYCTIMSLGANCGGTTASGISRFCHDGNVLCLLPVFICGKTMGSVLSETAKVKRSYYVLSNKS